MIKTVYFDLGNVLVFFSLPKMFEQLSNCFGVQPLEIKRIIFETPLREQYEKGWITTEDLHESVQKLAPRKCPVDRFLDAFTDIFTPNVDLWPLVAALKRNGIRLVLLSNTSEAHFEYLFSKYRILQMFDHHILSYKVGAWKPEIAIFAKALEIAQCKTHECFYTDDIAEFIHAAKTVGLQGTVFSNVPQLKEDLIRQGCTFLLEQNHS